MKKKKRKTNKAVVVRESDIRKLKKEIKQMKLDVTADVTRLATLFLLAWLVEEEYIDNDPDIIYEEYKHFNSWSLAVDEQLIKPSDIQKIIEDRLQTEIRIHTGETDEQAQAYED